MNAPLWLGLACMVAGGWLCFGYLGPDPRHGPTSTVGGIAMAFVIALLWTVGMLLLSSASW